MGCEKHLSHKAKEMSETAANLFVLGMNDRIYDVQNDGRGWRMQTMTLGKDGKRRE